MNGEEVRKVYESCGNPFAARAVARLGGGVVREARGATLRAGDGRQVVDLASGGFGYGHPKVIESVARQVREMPLSSRMFYSVPLARLARRLAHWLPGDVEVCFFGNAGTEAVEGALKLVKGFHRTRTRVVAAVGAYHGSSTGALSVCGIPSRRVALRGRPPLDVTFVPYGDDEAAARAIDTGTAAVILEPVLAGSGVRVPPPGYLAGVRARCTATGALFIADEITTGLGRTGRRWGVDHDGVSPDIVVLAGALGGGALPIGCYVATKAVNDRVYDKRDPLLHANTTGGNPSACTAALAALDVIEQEGLAERARSLGAELSQSLTALAARYGEIVAGTEGRGLLAAIRIRDVQRARAIQRDSLARGALVRLDGVATGEPAIGLRPPLLVTAAELRRGLEGLEAACAATASSGHRALQEVHS